MLQLIRDGGAGMAPVLLTSTLAVVFAIATTEGLEAAAAAPTTSWPWLLGSLVAVAVLTFAGLGSMWLWGGIDRAEPEAAPSGSSAGSARAGGSAGSPTEPSPLTSAAASAPAEAPPLRHPCQAPAPVGAPDSCPPTARSWCDEAEQLIACCAPGLVPIAGKKGSCGCPAGGVSDRPGAPTQCPRDGRPPSQSKQVLAEVLEPLRRQVRQCFTGSGGGTAPAPDVLQLAIELTPEGRVFSARSRQAERAAGTVVECALRRVRSTVFPPPVDGSQALEVDADVGGVAGQLTSAPRSRPVNPCPRRPLNFANREVSPSTLHV